MERKLKVNVAYNNDSNISNVVGIGHTDEKTLAIELCNIILNELKILTNSNTFNDNTIIINNCNIISRNISLNIHFNCFAIESAKGTEAIIPFKSSKVEQELAKILVDNISTCLFTKNRGVRNEITSFKQEPLFLIPNHENILLKICFITNKGDILMYSSKKDILSKIIAKSIYNYITK